MKRLKFDIKPNLNDDGEQDGYVSKFTDGKGRTTKSWWGSPPMSIDHVGREYLPNRHPNAMNARHDDFIKRRFKEERASSEAEKGAEG